MPQLTRRATPSTMPGNRMAQDTPAIPLTQRKARVMHPLGEASMMRAAHKPVRSLYIHVPFCFHKCHY